jgi:hypothetical protein
VNDTVDNPSAGDEERIAPPGWHRAAEHPDVRRPFPEVLREHMEVQGISDLEEFWERFQASGENLQRWRFMRMCEGTYGSTGDACYVRGLIFALGYDPESEEAARVSLSHVSLWRFKDRPRA